MALTPAQLAQRQQQYGAYMQAGAGIASLADQWSNEYHKNDNINLNAPGGETDAYGRPMYNLAGLRQNIAQIDTSGPSVGSVASGAGKGAAAGAAIGSVVPVIGTAIGGLVGGIVGGVGSFFSGSAASDEASRRKRLAEQNFRMAQKVYNSQMGQYNLQQSAQQAYYDQQNNNNREFNLYKFNSPYA